MSYLEPYWPAPGELVSLAACVLVLTGFAALGSLATRSREPGATELLAGWGLAAGVASLLPWLLPLDLRLYAICLGVVSVLALVIRRRDWARNRLWRPAVLMAPVLVVACGVPLDEWDSFSHWGLNAAWLWRFDALPSPGLPGSPSSNPDYPYGYPLALYLASLVRGAYIENAGATVNGLVLVAVAAAFARLAAGDDPARFRRHPWCWSAWGVLGVLVLNPGFVRSTTFATYADTAFAASALLLCLALWRFLEGEREERVPWAASAGVALALVSIKESGLIMLGVIAIAVVLVELRVGATRRRLPAALAALLPAAAVGLAWQAYVAGWMPSSFDVLPPDRWRFDLAPQLLHSAAAVVADHGLYYALLLVVVILGVRGWWAARDAVDRWCALAALVVLGHLATVSLAYLGASFTEAEVARAASFHRYGTQVGLPALASVILVAGAGAARRAAAPRRPWLPVTACAAVLLVGAPYLHRDHSAKEAFYSSAGAELAENLPRGATVGLMGWRDAPYGYFLLRYRLFRPGRPGRDLTLARVFQPLAADGAARERQLRRLHGREELTHLLVIEAGDLHGNAGPDMLLLARRAEGWATVDQWRME